MGKPAECLRAFLYPTRCMESPSKLLLFASDFDPWQDLRFAMMRGALPTLQRIEASGICGALMGLENCPPVMGWTSVSTGHHPAEHGVVGSILDVPNRCEAIWTRFSQAGWRSRVVAWPGVYPAEVVEGVFVTDRFASSHGANLGDKKGIIHPAELTDEFEQCKVSPEEIEHGLLQLFMPDLTPARLEHDKLAKKLLVHLSELYSNHNAVIAMSKGNDGLWVVYCPFLQNVRRDFGMFARNHRDDSEVSAEDRHFYGNVLAKAHQLRDLLLGELCQELGADVSICVVSSGGDWRNPRSILGERNEREMPAGYFAMSGPLFKQGGMIVEGATIFDLVPTLECAAGLAPRKENGMGRLLADVLHPCNHEESRDKSHAKEPVVHRDSARQCFAAPDFSNIAASGSYASDLGRALWQVGRVEEAWTWLEWAWFVGAGDGELALSLAECRASLGLMKEAAALDSALGDFCDCSPYPDLALAEAAGYRGEYAAMDQHARRAREKGATEMQVAPWLGQALLHLQRWAEAETLAREWLLDAPNTIWGKLLLARALYHQEQFAEAKSVTDALLENNPNSVIGWFTRGQIEAATGRMEQAKEAYAHAEQLNPRLITARAGRLSADRQIRKAKGEKIRYNFAGIDFQDPPHLRLEREKAEIVAMRRRDQEARETAWREQMAQIRGADMVQGTEDDAWLREPWPDEMARVRLWLGISGEIIKIMTRGWPERLIGAVGLVPKDETGAVAEMRLRVLPAYVGSAVHTSLLAEGLEMARQSDFAGVTMSVSADDPSAAIYLQSTGVNVMKDRFYEGNVHTILDRASKLWERAQDRNDGKVCRLEPIFHPQVARLAVNYGLLSSDRALSALAGDYDPNISTVYCIDDSPVGALLAKSMDQGRIYLEVFMVDPRHRASSGMLCSGMLTHAFKTCVKMGFTSVVFTCQPEITLETVKLAARMRCRKISERLVLVWRFNVS